MAAAVVVVAEEAAAGASVPSVRSSRACASSPATDEQLDLELAEFEKEFKGKFEAAKKDDLNLSALQRMSSDEIVKLAKKEGLEEQLSLPKQQLVFEVLRARAQKQGLMLAEGTLEILPDGYGFLRSRRRTRRSTSRCCASRA